MKRLNIFIYLLLLALLTGCARSERQSAEKTVFAMDTVMELKAYGSGADAALTLAAEEIRRLDAALSRDGADSEIAALNRTGASHLSPDAANIIAKALEISRLTDGAFDITIAPVMDEWGFFTKDYRVPKNAELSKALKKVGSENVSLENDTVYLKNGAQIDLGGIAKGYLSGGIAEIFKANGVRSGIISLGGNVYAIGEKPNGEQWRVAIQNPNGDGHVGSLCVSDAAVITSGGYQRFFERDSKIYHHIIDPKTGFPAENGLKSVTIICRDSAAADALSTALYVMGTEKAITYLEAHRDIEAVLVASDDSIYITRGITDTWQSEYDYKIIEGH